MQNVPPRGFVTVRGAFLLGSFVMRAAGYLDLTLCVRYCVLFYMFLLYIREYVLLDFFFYSMATVRGVEDTRLALKIHGLGCVAPCMACFSGRILALPSIDILVAVRPLTTSLFFANS